MASSEGSALVAMTTSAVGKQVFLRAATVTTTVMTSMTSEDTTDKKRPTAVKKVRLTPVKKKLAQWTWQACNSKTKDISPIFSKDLEYTLDVFKACGYNFFPLGKAWGKAAC